MVIRDPNNTRSWKYSFSEVFNKNNKDGFWSVHIYGTTAILEIVSMNSNGAFGYEIDKIAKGFPKENSRKLASSTLCGQDDTVNAICYQNTEPFVYNKSRAVARLLLNGVSHCTGWLIGDDGHLMTNEHCVENQSQANNITVEFMAQAGTCGLDCSVNGFCPGTIVATSTTLIKNNKGLDYALLSLPTNVSSTYGYLQLRPSGAILNERIYMPQQPSGYGKRIGLYSDVPSNGDGFARINSIDGPNSCSTSNNLGYYLDTRPGSSGSPVISYLDNLVVGLHFCPGCLNGGIPIEDIITDLGNLLPDNALPPPVELLGDRILCDTSNRTYYLANSDPSITPTWNVSWKLQKLSSTNTQVIVNPINGNVSGEAYVEAVLPTKTIRKNVWLGEPVAPTLNGPTQVNSGSWYTYSGGTIGATYYQWTLPYPFDVNQPIDQTSDNWQTWPTNSGYNSHIWTGNGGHSGYVQLASYNDCGGGHSSHIYVTHNNDNPCTTCDNPEVFPYPNVSDQSFTLDFTNYPLGQYYVRLYDTFSNILLERYFGNSIETFDTSAITEGTYFLHIYNGVELITKQLIIKH